MANIKLEPGRLVEIQGSRDDWYSKQEGIIDEVKNGEFTVLGSYTNRDAPERARFATRDMRQIGGSARITKIKDQTLSDYGHTVKSVKKKMGRIKDV